MPQHLKQTIATMPDTGGEVELDAGGKSGFVPVSEDHRRSNAANMVAPTTVRAETSTTGTAPVVRKRKTSGALALLRKNRIVLSRGCTGCCTLLEILLPVLFFLLLCLPRQLLDTEEYPNQYFASYGLSDRLWAIGLFCESDCDTCQPTCVDALWACPGQREHEGEGQFRLPVVPAEEGENVDDERNFFAWYLLCSDAGREFLEGFLGCAFTDPSEVPTSIQELLGDTAPESCGVYDPETGVWESINADNAVWFEARDELVPTGDSFASEADAVSFVEGAATSTDGVEPDDVACILVVEDSSPPSISSRVRCREGDLPPNDSFSWRWASLEPMSEPSDRTGTSAWRDYFVFLNVQAALDWSLMSTAFPDVQIEMKDSIKQAPWLEYVLDLGTVLASQFFPILMLIVYITTVVVVVNTIVSEKELRLKEGMLVMGLNPFVYWYTWFASHWVIITVSSVLNTLIGLYVFEESNPGILFLFYLVWTASLIFFSYFLSTFFSSAKVASIAAPFLYILAAVPAIIVSTSSTDGSAGWTISCLLPPSCIFMWGNALAILAAVGDGITGDTFTDSLNPVGEFSASIVFFFALIDIPIYMLLLWYFDKVWPQPYGSRLPPWFCFTRSYWGCSCTKRKTFEDSVRDEQTQLDSGNFEPLTNDESENVAIRVRDLVKEFNGATGPVRAVNRLNLDMVNGHVTGLLGHNGAGKTTTLQCLTGLLRITSGDAWIYDKSVREEIDEIRQEMGLCPQYDVLWPTMTVKEHIDLFCDLKGIGGSGSTRSLSPHGKGEWDAHRVEALAHVGLLEKVSAQTRTLSGGQKRKLSVAIAFLGDPRVVFLDEVCRRCWHC